MSCFPNPFPLEQIQAPASNWKLNLSDLSVYIEHFQIFFSGISER